VEMTLVNGEVVYDRDNDEELKRLLGLVDEYGNPVEPPKKKTAAKKTAKKAEAKKEATDNAKRRRPRRQPDADKKDKDN
ncbi:MAG: hypothetical protein AB8B55_23430, partial [Mariniblastus sp.]